MAARRQPSGGERDWEDSPTSDDGGDSDGNHNDEEYLADDASEDSDDDDGSDYEAERRASSKGAASRSAPPRARAAVPSYREDSDDDSLEDDGGGGDDDASGGDEEYAPSKKKKAAAATAAARPKRRAAAKASKRLKDSSSSEDEADALDEDDDEELARQLEAEMNGLRHRRGRGAKAAPTPSESTPKAGKKKSGGGAHAVRGVSARAASKGVSYAESDEDDSDGDAAARARAAKAAKEPLPAFEEGSNFDDEVERVLRHRDAAGLPPAEGDPWASRELHIKWKRYSHIHCSWDTRDTLSQLPGYKRVLNYMKRADELEAMRPYLSREEQELRDLELQMEEQLNQEHSQVERVFRQKANDGSMGSKYLVKWVGLPYAEATWEDEAELVAAGGQEQIDDFQAREARLLGPNRPVDAQRRLFKQQSTRALERQPDFLQFGKLRDYQLDGLNWMVYSWSQDRNAILADEMGLGKTVQCVSLLGYLAEEQDVRGPFLVVVPLSVVPNWIKEFRRWTPHVNCVVYVGDTRSREAIRAFEFDVDRRDAAAAANACGGVPRTTRFEVLITTFELILKDAPILSKIKWNFLVVDEAHRLKNAESALYSELQGFSFKNKLLVTGTPLQNSLRELWALLHFLEPAKFPDGDAFEAEYSMQTMDGVSGLHAVLRPHLLRRVIKEVERSLPPKNERILRVEMTPLQRQYYKWILSRNFKELNKGSKGGQVSLLNIIMELKKCCNHPFLFESAEENYRGTDGDRSVVDRLILTSGKLVLLDKLLRRLKQTGHRVLIFSQMVRMLDIVSDYLRLRGFKHQRLDGSTPAAARHQAMEQFNAPDSGDFAFLLSTRAGGLGINLATADTVVIFDSDWNPQNDLQAMSRAHRIGQTETVNIYRLVTSGSVEEDILERAKKKMVLDHLVIQRMDTSGRMVLDGGKAGGNAPGGGAGVGKLFGKDELTAILRFGAEELFKQAGDGDGDGDATAERDRRVYEEDIDAILERAEVVDAAEYAAGGGGGSGTAGGGGGSGTLSDRSSAFSARSGARKTRSNGSIVEEQLRGMASEGGERLPADDALPTLDLPAAEAAAAEAAWRWRFARRWVGGREDGAAAAAEGGSDDGSGTGAQAGPRPGSQMRLSMLVGSLSGTALLSEEPSLTEPLAEGADGRLLQQPQLPSPPQQQQPRLPSPPPPQQQQQQAQNQSQQQLLREEGHQPALHECSTTPGGGGGSSDHTVPALPFIGGSSGAVEGSAVNHPHPRQWYGGEDSNGGAAVLGGAGAVVPSKAGVAAPPRAVDERNGGRHVHDTGSCGGGGEARGIAHPAQRSSESADGSCSEGSGSRRA
mmetsp:Transcript_15385/g.45299  ORF Transcript_15385/g.45299 Transcript_15385/m.45299 type:complete len:1328 (-) Transcript_15385:31-4014(-)